MHKILYNGRQHHIQWHQLTATRTSFPEDPNILLLVYHSTLERIHISLRHGHELGRMAFSILINEGRWECSGVIF